MSIVPPPTCGTESAGAGSPMWKPMGPDDTTVGAAEPDPAAAADPEGSGEGVCGSVGRDCEARAAPGSGASTTTAPSATTATRAPASRPATIGIRVPTTARLPAVPGRHGTPRQQPFLARLSAHDVSRPIADEPPG